MEPSAELRLVPPNEAMLAAYATALETGWSPNPTAAAGRASPFGCSGYLTAISAA